MVGTCIISALVPKLTNVLIYWVLETSELGTVPALEVLLAKCSAVWEAVLLRVDASDSLSLYWYWGVVRSLEGSPQYLGLSWEWLLKKKTGRGEGKYNQARTKAYEDRQYDVRSKRQGSPVRGWQGHWRSPKCSWLGNLKLGHDIFLQRQCLQLVVTVCHHSTTQPFDCRSS